MKEKRQTLKSVVVVLFVEVGLLRSSEGTGGLNVTDVRRKRIPLLLSTHSAHKSLNHKFSTTSLDTNFYEIYTNIKHNFF